MNEAAGPIVNESMWWLSLGLGFVVILVVAILLQLVVNSARRIRVTVAHIWVAGPMIANNTAHVDVIRHINVVAGDILDGAGLIAGHAAHLADHASGCAGCPRCVTGWS